MSLFSCFQIVRYRWLDLIWPLLLTLIPLSISLNQNFEYEYWLSFSLLAAFITPFFGALRNQKLLDLPFKYFYFTNLFIIPIIIFFSSFTLSKITGSACEPNISFVWFFILGYPAWMIGIGFTMITRHLTQRKSVAIAMSTQALILLLLLLSAGIIFWFMPQKRITHLLLSHLHGPIYDTWIPIDWGIIYARLCHLLLGMYLAGLFFHPSHLKFNAKTILGFVIILFMFAGQTNFPSLHHGKFLLEKRLPLKKSHSYFTLHYSNPNSESAYEKKIDLLFHQAKFDIYDLSKIFTDFPEHTDIYVYPDINSKKLWFGGDRTDITDVVTPSIHILADSFPHPTMRHELVHALASKSAFFGLGFHPNMAFTEGIAVAFAPQDRDLSLSASIAAMKAQGRLPDLSELFSPLFWTNSGPRAYITAGGFIEHLLGTYGPEKVIKLYSGKSWSQVIQRSLANELMVWQQKIEETASAQKEDLGAEKIFRHPGVFYDQCPHSKAVMSRRPNKDLFTALRQPSGWNTSNYWQWRLRLNPNDKKAQFNEIWINLSDNVKHAKQYNLQEFSKLSETLDTQLSWPIKTLEDLDFLLLKVDLDFLYKHQEKDYLVHLSKINDNDDLTRRLDDATKRKILARILVMQSKIGLQQKLNWIKYLAGLADIPTSPPSDKQNWIFAYLKTFVKSPSILKPDELMTEPVSEQASASMRYMWHLNIGISLMKEKQWALASTSLEKAKHYATPAKIIYLDLLLKMSKWSLSTE